MRLRDGISFAAFVAIILLAVAYIASIGVRVGAPADRTELSMAVADTSGLVPGSSVLLRGVPVGKVSGITSSLSEATVDFYVDDQFSIPVDSEVRLENLSALGESYIGFVPRSEDGPYLQNGQKISTESIVQPASISELATSVVRVLNQLDPAALQRIINEADAALPDPNTTLPNIARAAQLLRYTVGDLNGSGRVLLDNFQTLLQNASWAGPLLANLAVPLPGIGVGLQLIGLNINRIGDQGAPQTLRDFLRFINRIQKLLDDRGADLKVLGTAMLPHFQGIAGSLMNFDTGQILGNFLAAVPEEGAITLHVDVPPPGG